MLKYYRNLVGCSSLERRSRLTLTSSSGRQRGYVEIYIPPLFFIFWGFREVNSFNFGGLR